MQDIEIGIWIYRVYNQKVDTLKKFPWIYIKYYESVFFTFH